MNHLYCDWHYIMDHIYTPKFVLQPGSTVFLKKIQKGSNLASFVLKIALIVYFSKRAKDPVNSH